MGTIKDTEDVELQKPSVKLTEIQDTRVQDIVNRLNAISETSKRNEKRRMVLFDKFVSKDNVASDSLLKAAQESLKNAHVSLKIASDELINAQAKLIRTAMYANLFGIITIILTMILIFD